MLVGLRRFASFAPRSATVFDNGKCLIYSEGDATNSRRDIFITATLLQSAFITYSALVFPTNFALGGLGFSSFLNFGNWLSARNSISRMFLTQDGNSLEVYTFSITGQIGKKKIVIPINEMKGSKVKTGYKILYKNYAFHAHLEGQIVQRELFTAALRGLEIENEKFVNNA